MSIAEDTVNIKDIQKKLLEILLYFQNFCDTHNLKFVLAGGTCLGAVRHKGFIPWDDDVDVFMLREDYEKLFELWGKYADTTRYALVRSNEYVNIHHTATEIKDCNTTFINKHSMNLDINQGLMIDVIPLDGVTPRKFAQIHQIIQGMLYCCFNFQRLPEHKGKFMYYLTAAALHIIKSDKLKYKIWKAAERNITKYNSDKYNTVASFGEGLKIMRQHFPREWFLHPTVGMFEGHEMPIPANADLYLRISYGDYMKLPPVSAQVPRHNTVFIDLNKSYKEYKGIKYYIKDQVKEH